MNQSNSKRFKISPRLALLAGSVAGLFALLQACSSDGGNPAPSTPVITAGGGGSGGNAGSGTSAGAGGKAQGGSSGSQSTGGTSNSEAGAAGETSGGTGGTGGGTVTCDPASTGPKGCFKCPDTDIKFYNQCTSSQCSPFDDAKRLGLHAATLPNLPG